MRRAVLLLLMLAIARVATAQVFTTPKGEAENVRFEQVGGGTVNIFYDLVASDPRAVFLVTLDASQDRGSTFTVRPTSVSGDVGQGVAPGTGKRIVWESGRDVERLEIDQFRFRISAQAGPLELKVDPAAASSPAAPEAAEKPPVTPRTAPASPSPVAAKPKSGGGATKWLVIGGGAAAAAGVAVAAGGGSGGSSSTPTPPTTVNRKPTITSISQNQSGTLLVAATEVTYGVVASDPDGDPMTATWSLGGFTPTAVLSNGQAATTRAWMGSGTAFGTVTVSDGRGGSAVDTYAGLPISDVTGVWTGRLANVDIRLNLEQVKDTASVGGDYLDALGRTSRVSGTVSNPRVLRFSVVALPDAAGSPGGTIVFTLEGSADLRRFTGTTGSGDAVTIVR
jgi:hypothetical protein